HAPGPFARAETIFAVHTRIDIIEDDDRAFELFFKCLADMKILPAQIGRLDDTAFFEVNLPGAAHTDAGELFSFHTPFIHRVANRRDNPREARLGPLGPFRLPSPFA